jgi:DNA-directed RNA polymerase
MAKVFPNFREAITYLKRADLSNMCHLLDVLGGVKWRVNKKVLEMIEHSWSIGGSLGEIPKRFNER